MRFLLFILLAAQVIAVPLDKLRQEMVRWEGYRLSPYRDGSGYAVGIGHNLTAHGEEVRTYTAAEVEAFFKSDIQWAIAACRNGIDNFDDLPDDVQIVCISVAFTVGRTGFQRFKDFRLAMSYRAYNAAATELRLSKWAAQVSPSRRDHHIDVLLRKGGLTSRR